MTTLSITGTFMNNYASISLLDGSFYDKADLDNQFSLKADVSELTSLVTTDYLESKYTNRIDLTILILIICYYLIVLVPRLIIF